ncbi:MAG TPA: peptidoglycan editing factor PgeF [Nitrospirota bacterium]|nr:peptidoglycan editing factor PgeF [Nitrospirota bacterium]
MQRVEGEIANREKRDLPRSASGPYLTIPTLDNLQRIVHVFTTRNNSLGARNRGIKSPSDWDVVADLFNITADRVVTANQAHGDVVVIVDDHSYRLMHTTEADAMITSTPGIAIGVETADCVPALLIDPTIPAVAAVHAGWRSTVKNIVRKTVKLMHDRLGSDPTQLIAAFGPAIGPECYEVDEPVMGPVREAFPFWKDVASPRGQEKWSLDLVKANRMELLQAGVEERNIHSLGICTACRRDLFYSFRAEGRTGRMLSVVMIKP